MCLARSGTVGGGGSAASRAAAAEENGGEGAPVCSGRGGVVCELREDEAELEMGSAWAERVWNVGSTVSFELTGVWAWRLRCSGGSGLGDSELASGLGCWGALGSTFQDLQL